MSILPVSPPVDRPAVSEPVVPLPPFPRSWKSLAHAFVAAAREHRRRPAIADSTGADLSFGDTLIRTLALGRALGRILGPETYVGLFLPPCAPAAVANLAVTLWGKVPVNLNYTASREVLDSSVDQCGIRHVLTSRKFLDKIKLVPKGTLVLMEDVAKAVTSADKAWAFAMARFCPRALMGSALPGLRGDRLDETAAVIFTSGSTGDPKGVVLSNRNILSNVHQFRIGVRLTTDDVALGVLPFFHSFGLTVPIWTVLTLGLKVVYHTSPLDARVVGDLCEKHGVTVLLGTPTFMATYIRKCPPAQFAKLRLLLLGAEKLRPDQEGEFRDKLGIEPLQGYGCTELSPVVAVNVPDDRVNPFGVTVHGNRPGSVGQLLPGTEVKTVDPETGADLPAGATGLIQVRGPQVMVGYLNRPEATVKVIRDGFYNTGDIGYHDPEGFLFVTGRLSRFSKIGGEMVPHEGVEQALIQAAGFTSDEPLLAVTSVSDPRRGERLAVLHVDLRRPVAEVCRDLAAGPLPRLWQPSATDFVRVEAIPMLGTGKLDLRRIRDIAQERLGA